MFVRSAQHSVLRIEQTAFGNVVRQDLLGLDAEQVDSVLGQRFTWTVADAATQLETWGAIASPAFVSSGVLWNLVVRAEEDGDGCGLSLELHATLAGAWQSGESVAVHGSFDLPHAPAEAWWRQALRDDFEVMLHSLASGIRLNRLLDCRRMADSLRGEQLVVDVDLYQVLPEWQKDSTHMEARYARAAEQHGMTVAMADALGVRHGLYGISASVRQDPTSGELSVKYTRGAFLADNGIKLLSVLLLDNLMCHYGGDARRAMQRLPQVLGMLHSKQSGERELLDEHGRDLSYLLEPCSGKSPSWRGPTSSLHSSRHGDGSGDEESKHCGGGTFWATTSTTTVAAATTASSPGEASAAGEVKAVERKCVEPNDAGEPGETPLCCAGWDDEYGAGGTEGIDLADLWAAVHGVLDELEAMPSWGSVLVAFFAGVPACLAWYKLGNRRFRSKRGSAAATAAVERPPAACGSAGAQLRRSASVGSGEGRAGGSGTAPAVGRHEAPSKSRGGRSRGTHGRQQRGGASGARTPPGAANLAAAAAPAAPAAAGLLAGTTSGINGQAMQAAQLGSHRHWLVRLLLLLISGSIYTRALPPQVGLLLYGAAFIAQGLGTCSAAEVWLLKRCGGMAKWCVGSLSSQTVDGERASREASASSLDTNDTRSHPGGPADSTAAAGSLQSRNSSVTSQPGSLNLSTLPVIASFAAAALDLPSGPTGSQVAAAERRAEPRARGGERSGVNIVMTQSDFFQVTQQGAAEAVSPPSTERQQLPQPQQHRQRQPRTAHAAAARQQSTQRPLPSPLLATELLQLEHLPPQLTQQRQGRMAALLREAAERAIQRAIEQQPAAPSRTETTANPIQATSSDPRRDLLPAVDQTVAHRSNPPFDLDTSASAPKPMPAAARSAVAAQDGPGLVEGSVAGGADNAGGASDSHLCLVCLDAPRQHGFLHGGSMHIGICDACSELLQRRPQLLCPVCREPVERMVTIFS